jgi:hypothetical protein
VREGGRRGRQGCRYDGKDARGTAPCRPRHAEMPRTEGRRPASDGADVAQRRESNFPEWVRFAPTRNGSRLPASPPGAAHQQGRQLRVFVSAVLAVM